MLYTVASKYGRLQGLVWMYKIMPNGMIEVYTSDNRVLIDQPDRWLMGLLAPVQVM